MKKTLNIKCNNFVRRQTPESKFSHVELLENGQLVSPWESLEAWVSGLATESYLAPVAGRPGVFKLEDVPAKIEFRDGDIMSFFSGVMEVTPETQLEARVTVRREGEQPYVEVLAKGEKTPARQVDIILYTPEALALDAAHSDADYEIVSINCRITDEAEPPTPMAMARNFLNLPGGSKAEYTAKDFAEAIVYWSRRAMIAPKE